MLASIMVVSRGEPINEDSSPAYPLSPFAGQNLETIKPGSDSQDLLTFAPVTDGSPTRPALLSS